MISLTYFYEVWVWLKNHEEDRKKVIIEARPPLGPMNVRDFCCRTGVFLYADYQRIRYRRVSRREEKK